jgi:N-methylhydantoinase B
VTSTAKPSTLDGVELAVLTSRLESIARSMMNTVIRSGRSRILNTSRDCSCCILTATNELLVTAESIPIHVMGGPDLMAKAMTELHPTLKRGDAFLHNSPYHGNSHPADHSILVPVIDDEGVHRFTVFSKAHQADCGNALPTTYAGAARDVYEEGALMFPAVRVQEDYRDVGDVIRMAMLRIRVPEQWWGDYLALLGAARIGERRMLELAQEVGWDTLEAYTREWFDYSELRMITAITKLPRGKFTASNMHDPMPTVPDGVPVKVTVEVDPEDARIQVDLRDNPDCQPCGMNLSEATARSSALIGVLNSIDHTVPVNAGSLRRLKVLLRENCAVGIPRHPASCSTATTNLADRVTNPIQRGLAELEDGIGLGEAGLSLPASLAVVSGHDPRHDGAPFVNELMLPSGTGGPGGPEADGWLPFIHPGNAGMALRDAVEIDELSFPMRIVEQRVVTDTEGAGRFRGAPSGLVEYGPIGGAKLEVMNVCDGTIYPPDGARGGLGGAAARHFRRKVDDTLIELDPYVHEVLEDGETIVSYSCGGGGYGPPTERDADRVAHDVREGYVSRQRARDVYGVILDERLEPDVAATARERSELDRDRLDRQPDAPSRANPKGAVL